MHETGGHFPAWENPDLLAEDIWAFFGNEQLSDTKKFRARRAEPLLDRKEL